MKASRGLPVLRAIPVLIVGCLAGVPVLASDMGPGSTQTSRYVFLPDQSELLQTGGIAGVHRMYSVKGQFVLIVDPNTGVASFSQVDAIAIDGSSPRRSLDPNEVFNVTSLAGTVVSDTVLSFMGKAADGSDVRITATVQDDRIHLVAQTAPPPNSADFFVFSMDALAQRKYAGGAGEPNDPYQIATAADLIALGNEPNDYDKHFILMNDLDLDPNLPDGRVFDKAVIAAATFLKGRGEMEVPFAGVFDGNDHTISHLTIAGVSHLGLFGHLTLGAQVRDLGVVDVNVAGSGEYVGGLVGSNGEYEYDQGGATITGCYCTGAVSGSGSVGGLVGYSDGRVTQCYSACTVQSLGEGAWAVGGLVGNNNGSVAQCQSSGVVTSLGDSACAMGGLVGSNYGGNVIACYSTCVVSGNTRVGGLVGDNSQGHVIQSYSGGAVSSTGAEVGGLVGGDVECEWRECYSTGVVTRCFWDIETSGQTTSAGGEGRTTVEMQTVATFTEAGWDFVGPADGPSDVWAQPEGGGYPILWWQLAQLPPLPAFSGGTGQVGDPYLVSTAEELNSIGSNPRLMESHFRLIADVNLVGVYFYPIGNESFAYAGVFDGNDHAVSQFAYDSNGVDNIGLFGHVHGGAIRDLGLINPNIHAGMGNCVGSLVGCLAEGSVAHCYASGGAVSANGSVGGLVGGNGLWDTPAGSVTDCYSSCAVTGAGGAVGGLVGANGGSVTQCYGAGAVNGYWYVGGLVGYNSEGSVIQCYSTGAIKGWREVGGLVGCTISDWWWGGNVAASFWDIQTSGQTASAGGEGKTTAEMLMAQTFLDAGWDFADEATNGTEDIWWIYEGADYPRLWFETVRAVRAFHPDPPNGSSGVSRSPVLSWASAGPGMEHDVYLGDDEAAVTSATPASSGIYRGRQPSEVTTYSPGNLEWRKTYYWRIDEVNQADPTVVTTGRVWCFTVIDFMVSRSPEDHAIDMDRSPVLTWTPGGQGLVYDVYLGEAEDSVANATTESQGIYRGRQTSEMTSYSPPRLEWGKTYYWRIDFVDEADPAGVWKTDVWSFTVIDFLVSRWPGHGAGDVVQSPVLTWEPGGPGLQYDVYFGDAEDSVANATRASQGVYRGRQQSEMTAYSPPGLKWAKTYYWRIDVVDEADPVGLWKSDVWSFTTAYFATSPYPADGDVTDNLQSLVLSWVAAAPGVQQDVYFGEDEAAVANATPDSAGTYRGRQPAEQASYAPGQLELGRTYYWRIDGVDPADPGTPSKGKVWSFRAVYLAVAAILDDFESYTDDMEAGQAIFQTWMDGMGYAGSSGAYPGNGTGSMVGYVMAPYAEQSIVHGGRQSMSMCYDNTHSLFYSETQRTWATPQDWTIDGAHDVQLYFRGTADNKPDCLYAGIQDTEGHTAVMTHSSDDALLVPQWRQWRIPLRDLQAGGVNLTQVKTIIMGVGSRRSPLAGGTGIIYFDDICLMKPMP